VKASMRLAAEIAKAFGGKTQKEGNRPEPDRCM